MEIFLDTTNVQEIKELQELGIVDGVTTNPSLISKAEGECFDILKNICKTTNGPVSVEVIAFEFEHMIKEALILTKIHDNVVIKLPLTLDGLKACKYLRAEGILVNITLCFTANQAILAAKAGANYVSPFVGRLEDNSSDGLSLISDIRYIYSNYHFETKILAASIRSPFYVSEVAKLGADIVTVSPQILRKMIFHPQTQTGLEAFISDWRLSGKKL